MRACLLIVFAQCSLVWPLLSARLPFERDGEPFFSSKFEVVWAATNQLPATVRIHQVIPSSFSDPAVSYVQSLGGTITPRRGAMNFYKPSGFGAALTNVPDQAKAYALGTNVLITLGVSFSELEAVSGRPRAWYSPGTRGRFDKATRQRITEPCTMGVSFRRTIDGLECHGQEIRLRYESNESLTQLEVRWHGLKLAKDCVVATPEQILSWIKEGRARAHAVETTGSRWIKVSDIRKVTIKEIAICYDARPDWRNDDQPPDNLYPYANLQCQIEFSSDDKETVWLSTPIIKEALCRPLRNDSEFNIYPSERRTQIQTGE